mmetsp:Transcript_18241/g.33057  ORF Transcript_18241/g.33057 Transcript_18241/m.33057 type:complete len:187 (+) Transcript_18241:109-669(+)
MGNIPSCACEETIPSCAPCGRQCNNNVCMGGNEFEDPATSHLERDSVWVGSQPSAGRGTRDMSQASSPAVGGLHDEKTAYKVIIEDMQQESNGARRPPFEVLLERAGRARPLGLLVSADDHPHFLMVDDIRPDSMVDDWNNRCLLTHKVGPGDRITSVNGSRCGAEQMLEILQMLGKDEDVRLRIE